VRAAFAPLALLILPFLVLGHAFLPGRVLSPVDNVFGLRPWSGLHPAVTPTNPLLVDITLMFHPFALYAGDEIRAGRFPLWNPHTFGGAPFFANPQTALLFPLTALVYVLPYSLALTLMSVLKLSTAGVGMYWFLRRLTLNRWAAFIAGLTFAFSALVITWLQWSYASAVVLLPLLFAMTELVRERPGWRAVAGLSLVIALAFFAGYPQRVVCWLLVLGIWVLYRARAVSEPLRFVGRWVIGVILGITLAAVQLLPFAEYLRGSAVLAYRSEWMLYFPLPFRSLIAVLMPYFFGSPTGKDFWGPLNFNEISVSVGIVPWLLLPVAALAARAETGTQYFAAMLALSASLIYGVPVIGAALAALPVLGSSIAARNADLFVFSLAALSGIALNALTKLGSASRHAVSVGVRVAFGVLMVTALAFVAGYYAMAALRPMVVPLWSQYLGLLLLSTLATILILRLIHSASPGPWSWVALAGVQLAALLPLAVTYNPVVDSRLLDYSPPPVVKHLQARSAQDGGRAVFSGIGAANLGTIFRLFEFGGYDGMTPRYVEQLADPRGSLEVYTSGALRVTLDAASPVLDLLGVRYLILPPGTSSPGPHFTLDYQGADAVVYRNARALPRAFVVFRARMCVDDAAALAQIENGQIDFRNEVVLAGCHDAPPTPAAPGRLADATITTSTADRVVIATTSDAAGYLVLTDSWFPGWRAWVDGVEHTVWRANHALRAITLPPGRHEVQFRYVPSTLRWGLGLSGLASLLIVGMVWAPRRLVGHATVVLFVTALLLLATPAAAEAKLTGAPFALEVSPHALTEGEQLAITLRPIDARPIATTVPPYDVYLSLISDSDARRGWVFMSSSGQVSPTPAPFRAKIARAPLEPFNATLSGLPPGWYTIRAQFVKSSATEPGRKHYVHQPLWTTIRVDPQAARRANVMPVAASLAAVTLAALGVVWLLPRRWRAQPSQAAADDRLPVLETR
jgi:Bacterial membrane protein YfhO